MYFYQSYVDIFRKPLKELFDSAAQFASDGVTVDEDLAHAIAGLQNEDIPDDLKQLLTKNDNTTFLELNDMLTQPVLAQTLRVRCYSLQCFCFD